LPESLYQDDVLQNSGGLSAVHFVSSKLFRCRWIGCASSV
jgi:hypothetical protein